uniref:Uncharacterized protein n=1 Tax=Glossina brevipalpis TaxID=37001 RepID=A0A1A9X242_9MUSC
MWKIGFGPVNKNELILSVRLRNLEIIVKIFSNNFTDVVLTLCSILNLCLATVVVHYMAAFITVYKYFIQQVNEFPSRKATRYQWSKRVKVEFNYDLIKRGKSIKCII